MVALATVILVIGTEAFLLGIFQKSIHKKRPALALASVLALVTFMILANVEWFKGELRNKAGESTAIAWTVCALLLAFIFAPSQFRSPISDITSSWNQKTGNSLAVLSALALFLAIRG
jgi:hypothetical protein